MSVAKYRLVSIHDTGISEDQLKKLWRYDVTNGKIAFGEQTKEGNLIAPQLKKGDILLAKHGIYSSPKKRLLGVGIVRQDNPDNTPDLDKDKARITQAGIEWDKNGDHPCFVDVEWIFEIPKGYEIPSKILNYLQQGSVNTLKEWTFFAFLQNLAAKYIDFWFYHINIEEERKDNYNILNKHKVICFPEHDKLKKLMNNKTKPCLDRGAVWITQVRDSSTNITDIWYGSDIRPDLVPKGKMSISSKSLPRTISYDWTNSPNARYTIKLREMTNLDQPLQITYTKHTTPQNQCELPINVTSYPCANCKFSERHHDKNLPIFKKTCASSGKNKKYLKGSLKEVRMGQNHVQNPYGGTVQNINDSKFSPITASSGYHYCTYRDYYHELLKIATPSVQKIELALLWINAGIMWWKYNPLKTTDNKGSHVDAYFNSPKPICTYGDEIPTIAKNMGFQFYQLGPVGNKEEESKANKEEEWKNLGIDDLDIYHCLQTKRQTIFYGPPGTGKTYTAKKIAELYDDYKIVVFHPSSSYEEFIEGIKPTTHASGTLNFELQDGVFKKLIDQAESNPNKMYLLIIDEINRGQTSAIFGELMNILEYRDKKVNLTYQEPKRKTRKLLWNEDQEEPKREISIPKNIHIIGTMNTADKEIAPLDYALRRRFTFNKFEPDTSLLKPNSKAKKFLEDINKAISDEDYKIGHSFFMETDDNTGGNTVSDEEFTRIIKTQIKPLLKEYETHFTETQITKCKEKLETY